MRNKHNCKLPMMNKINDNHPTRVPDIDRKTHISFFSFFSKTTIISVHL